jgi:hypothetical protein
MNIIIANGAHSYLNIPCLGHPRHVTTNDSQAH